MVALLLRRFGSRRLYSTTLSRCKDYPAHTLFPMPALSPTMESGTIASWTQSVGSSFTAGDVLCTIETDKASVDFEAQDDGVLAKILGETGVEIPCGVPICVVVEEASDVEAFADFVVEAAAAAPTPEAPAAETPSAASAAPAPASSTLDKAFVLLPSARHLAESNGLDATGLAGSGKGGRVTKGDVMEAMAAGTLPALTKSTSAAPAAAVAAPTPSSTAAPVDVPIPQPQASGPFEDVPNNKMRKIIASRLTESKRDVPHFYTSMQIPLDNVLSLRKQLAGKHDVKVSVNDFIIRACALALRDVPQVNASFNGTTVKANDSVDISVAVATPTGLITPIVFGSDALGLSQITDTVRDLATRAREGKLAPHEYQGGTFSVSNLGMFGIDEFSAVINPPQAAILAVGGGSRTIVPTPFGSDSKPGIQTLMTARLSADRRVVDEATASLFMTTLKEYLQKPDLMML